MQYAATRPTLPSRRTILAPLVALVVGAGAAVGAYALIDDQATEQAPGKVVFVDTPGPGDGVRGIDDTAASAAIASAPPNVVVPYLSHGSSPTSDAGRSAKDEAATAAAIGSGSSQDAGSANRTDPHGTAAQLHAR
jgi:hypothetical protein